MPYIWTQCEVVGLGIMNDADLHFVLVVQLEGHRSDEREPGLCGLTVPATPAHDPRPRQAESRGRRKAALEAAEATPLAGVGDEWVVWRHGGHSNGHHGVS